MNKILMKTAFLAVIAAHTFTCDAAQISIMHDDGYQIDSIEDVTGQIPVINVGLISADTGWQFIPDVAQYKEADWSNCVGISHNLSCSEARWIANNNDDITFFFYVKGYTLLLEDMNAIPPIVRVFHLGDAVFFSGDPSTSVWWGSAPGLADGYVKQ